MKSQMVRTSETSLTDFAFEGFGAGMLTIVTGQFIRSGETPLTFWPMALIWLLSYQSQNNHNFY